jgi:hypothetical protein
VRISEHEYESWEQVKQLAEAGDERARRVMEQMTEARRQAIEAERVAGQSLRDRLTRALVPPYMAAPSARNGVRQQLIDLFASIPMQERPSALLNALLAPGTLLGDVMIVMRVNSKPEEREASVRRLIDKHYPRRALFHSNRWQLIEPYLYTRVQEVGQSERRVWDHLMSAAIFLACRAPEAWQVSLDELQTWLRTRLRVEIEKDLLHGRTLDARREVELPETAHEYSLELKVEQTPATEEMALLEALGGLTLGELELLFAERGTLKDMAEVRGMSYAALRKHKERLVKRLRAFVSQME